MKILHLYLFLILSTQFATSQNYGVVLVEDFNSATVPAGWTQSVSSTPPAGATSTATSSGWAFGQTGYSSLNWTVPASIDASQFTIANDDAVDQNREDDLLMSPVLNLTHFDSVVFLYDVFYNGQWGSEAYFVISYDAGANWLYLAINDSAVWAEDGVMLPRTITVSGTNYTFNDQMKIGFNHTDGGVWADGFAVDNVIVAGFNNPCDDIVTIPSCGATQSVTLGGQGVNDFNFTGACSYLVPGAEQLYRFTPTTTGIHTLIVESTTGNSWFDYMIKPTSSGCDSLGWTCLGDGSIPGIYNSANLTAGVQYLILVDNEYSDTETHTFHIQCPAGSFTPCLTSASTYIDLNTAGGAPCNYGNGCVPTDPDFTSLGIGVYGSEAYLLDDVQAGYDYVVDMCSGFGSGSWIPEITIVAPDGTTVDAWNGEQATGSSATFLDQCSLGWTATQNGTYTIVINQLGTAAGDAPNQTSCATTYAVDNGNLTVYCGQNEATCISCEAGTITSPAVQNVCPGETFQLTLSGNNTPGSYSLFFDNTNTNGTGGAEASITVTEFDQSDFPLLMDADINGVLSFNQLPPLSGTWLIKVIVVDGSGTPCDSTGSFTVNFIDDNTAPVPTIGTLSNVSAQCEVTSLSAPTATDNCAGTLTGTHNVSLPITANTTIIWIYDDGNGNTATQLQNVVINDVTAPVPSVANLPAISDECEITFLTAPTANDNCEGAITGTQNASLPITASTIITWTYEDGNGNTSTQTQNVVITPIVNSLSQIDPITITADASGYNYQWVDCDNGNAPIQGEVGQNFVAANSGNYAVEIDNGTCSVTSSCIQILTVGIDEIESESNVYVALNRLTIILQDKVQSGQFTMMDASGRSILTTSLNGNTTTLEINVAVGVYFIRIETEKGIDTHKIMLN